MQVWMLWKSLKLVSFQSGHHLSPIPARPTRYKVCPHQVAQRFRLRNLPPLSILPLTHPRQASTNRLSDLKSNPTVVQAECPSAKRRSKDRERRKLSSNGQPVERPGRVAAPQRRRLRANRVLHRPLHGAAPPQCHTPSHHPPPGLTNCPLHQLASRAIPTALGRLCQRLQTVALRTSLSWAQTSLIRVVLLSRHTSHTPSIINSRINSRINSSIIRTGLSSLILE